MKKYALIGRNIQDSLSPVIHQAYGCQYDLLDIEEYQLEWALARSYDGFNVTAPYKKSICKHLKFAQYPEIINTIKRKNGLLEGYDTDSAGFMSAIRQAGVYLGGRITIIGTGAMAELLQRQIKNYRILDSRSEEYNFAKSDGVVNCSPRQNIELHGLSKHAWVMDLGYKDSTFIDNARARGNFAFNGMGMLIAQAGESQRIWNS